MFSLTEKRARMDLGGIYNSFRDLVALWDLTTPLNESQLQLLTRSNIPWDKYSPQDYVLTAEGLHGVNLPCYMIISPEDVVGDVFIESGERGYIFLDPMSSLVSVYQDYSLDTSFDDPSLNKGLYASNSVAIFIEIGQESKLYKFAGLFYLLRTGAFLSAELWKQSLTPAERDACLRQVDITQSELMLHGMRIKGKLRKLYETGKAIRLVELKPVTDKKTCDGINSRLSIYMYKAPAAPQVEEDLHSDLISPELSSEDKLSEFSGLLIDFPDFHLPALIDVSSQGSNSELVSDSSESNPCLSETASRGFSSKRYKRAGRYIVPPVQPSVKAGSSSSDWL